MEGAAVEAIRNAEASLARQQTVTAQVDLQVVTAVLNAHTDRDRGTATLEQLQHDLESAVVGRPDLGTPAGARSFQHYLIGKVRDIRAVLDEGGLDATSKAALAAALSALYTSSPSSADEISGPHAEPITPPLEPLDPASADPNAAPPQPLPASSTPPSPQAMPSWGAAPPASGGFPLPSLPDLPSGTDQPRHHAQNDPAADPPPEDPPVSEAPVAERPALAKVITDAVGGTPIAEAFTRQGITIPPAGSPIAEPVDPAQLTAGDIGIFADRHALALGNGKALLDNQIQPVTAIGGPGFIGWQHPPATV